MNNRSKMMVAVLCFGPSSLVLSAAASFADDDDANVRWRSIVGVISAPNIDNPVGDIDSGTFPWSARSGRARVNLSTGAASFRVATAGTRRLGTCQYGWRDGRGHPWSGHGCWNDLMCRDGNPRTWDRCVSGYDYDDDGRGRCKHGWRQSSSWWWGHEHCRNHPDCRDGNSSTWDRCEWARTGG